MSKRKCENCLHYRQTKISYYVNKGSVFSPKTYKITKVKKNGGCHKNPPKVKHNTSYSDCFPETITETYWPSVTNDDVCGLFEEGGSPLKSDNELPTEMSAWDKICGNQLTIAYVLCGCSGIYYLNLSKVESAMGILLVFVSSVLFFLIEETIKAIQCNTREAK